MKGARGAACDHKNLDLDVLFMQGRHSSTENPAVAIWEQLEGRSPASWA